MRLNTILPEVIKKLDLKNEKEKTELQQILGSIWNKEGSQEFIQRFLNDELNRLQFLKLLGFKPSKEPESEELPIATPGEPEQAKKDLGIRARLANIFSGLTKRDMIIFAIFGILAVALIGYFSLQYITDSQTETEEVSFAPTTYSNGEDEVAPVEFVIIPDENNSEENNELEPEPIDLGTLEEHQTNEVVLPEKFSILPEEFQKNPWFIQGEDRFQVSFTPPSSFSQLFKNLGWIILTVLGFQLVRIAKAEAEDRGEKKDYKLLKIGLLVAILSLIFGSGLAETFSGWYKWLKPEVYSGELTQYTLWAVGAAIAVGFFIGAALAGEDDFTPPGVGLFILGLILKLFLTQPTIIPTIGSWLMFAGITVIIVELFRQHGTTAILLVIGAWLMGGLAGFILGGTFWGLTRLVEPLSQTSISTAPILAFVYKIRVIIGWIIGYLTGSSFVSSTLGMSNISKSLKVKDGSQVGQLVSASKSVRFDGKILYLQSIIIVLTTTFM